jgi:hypothetical protein
MGMAPGAVAFDAASGTSFISIPAAGMVQAVAAGANTPYVNVSASGLVQPVGIAAGSGGAIFIADNSTGSVWLAIVPALAPAFVGLLTVALVTSVTGAAYSAPPQSSSMISASEVSPPVVIAANFSLAMAGVDAGVVAVAVWPLSSAAEGTVTARSVMATAAASSVFILDSVYVSGSRVLQLNGSVAPLGSVAPTVLATLDAGGSPRRCNGRYTPW